MKFKKSLLLTFCLLFGATAHPIGLNRVTRSIGSSAFCTAVESAVFAAVLTAIDIYRGEGQNIKENVFCTATFSLFALGINAAGAIYSDKSKPTVPVNNSLLHYDLTDDEIKEICNDISKIEKLDENITVVTPHQNFQNYQAYYILSCYALEHPQLKTNQEIIDKCHELILTNINTKPRDALILAASYIENGFALSKDNAIKIIETIVSIDSTNDTIKYYLNRYMNCVIKKFPNISLSPTLIISLLSEPSVEIDGKYILNCITSHPEIKRDIARFISKYSLSQIKHDIHHPFVNSIMLERYLKGEEINDFNGVPPLYNTKNLPPLLKKLKEIQNKEKIGPLLPNLHEFNDSPTKNHAIQYSQGIVEKFSTKEIKSLKRLTKEIITLEEQEKNRGHYTFANGGPKKVYPLQYWFTKLFEITNNVDLGDYLFTRFESNHNIFKKAFHTLKRWEYLRVGSGSNVFMQCSLLNGCHGINPASYYLRNASCSGYHNSIENIFKQFGYEQTYAQFKDDLSNLEHDYLELCPYGKVLLFSFSPKALKKCVYAGRYGDARSVNIADPETGKTTATHDIETIVKTLKHNPALIKDYDNDLEFCFIPTIDYGLHPDVAGKDVRIFNLTGADPEKLKTYKEKEQALFEKIKTAIKTQA